MEAMEGDVDESKVMETMAKSKGFDLDGENGFGDFGGYMNAKIAKLDQQFSHSTSVAKESDLFAGISIFVNGRTNPSSDELRRIMMIHGGIFHQYERSHTKYIIASNLPDVKWRNHTTKLIVKPEWITKCLEEKRIVDYSHYLLVTNRNTNQPKIQFTKAESKPAIDSKTTMARTANDPKFLSEFYNNSRLHHISTLGATFKQYISDLRQRYDGSGFLARQELLEGITERSPGDNPSIRWITHIDMDCFFVSVGLRNRPDLIGVPVAVTHSRGNGQVPERAGVNLEHERQLHEQRLGQKDGDPKSFFSTVDTNASMSEIASCSYEARAKGVKNGMFVGTALKLCPNLKTIQYDFEGYREVAFTLYNIISKYTLDIEAVSCDEMYVDLSDVLNSTKIPVLDLVNYLRNEIKNETKCPCSAGIGSNRIQARMATKRAKPNGQFQLLPDAVKEYFKSIPISDLPGVGRSIAYKLERKMWQSCGDLQKVSVQEIQSELGKKIGENLHNLAQGKDNKELNYEQVRKSVSAEVNYGIRFTEAAELETFLIQLCEEVHSRLTEIHRRGKCITLKYMVRAEDAPVETAKFMGHGICDTVNKSHSLQDYTADAEVIKREILQLNREMALPPSELRGIGIQISKLDENRSMEQKSSKLLEMFSKVTEKAKTAPTATIVKHEEAVSPQKLSTTTKPGRGRPRKIENAVKSRDISDLLKTVEIPLDVDMNVINELPEEFRADAIRSHKVLMKRYNSDTKLKPQPSNDAVTGKNNIVVDPEYLNALPPEIRREVELDLSKIDYTDKVDVKGAPVKSSSSMPSVSNDNIFIQSNYRELLENWVTSTNGEAPDPQDVEMIIQNAIELINDRRIEAVHLQFRFLYRICRDSESRIWHTTYNSIVGRIQPVMIENFGCELAINLC